MQLSHSIIRKGFIAAGLMNLSVLIFSRGFTNAVIAEYDAELMSDVGLLLIILWGLAYISVANNYQHVKWLVGVFALEKFIYGCAWIRWMSNHSLADVAAKDKMAAAFYATYGLNDWVFCLFFLFVFIQLVRNKQ